MRISPVSLPRSLHRGITPGVLQGTQTDPVWGGSEHPTNTPAILEAEVFVS